MNETRCPISLEDFSENEEIMEIIGCGHIFKTNNLLEWLSRESNCPVCRYNILNYINNTANRNNTESESETENINSMSSEPTIIASVEFEIDTE
jgi:NAD(P)H-nitrite reductase large subunit